MTEAVGRHNVLDNAYFEVDDIRRQHLAELTKRCEDEEEEARQQSLRQVFALISLEGANNLVNI